MICCNAENITMVGEIVISNYSLAMSTSLATQYTMTAEEGVVCTLVAPLFPPTFLHDCSNPIRT